VKIRITNKKSGGAGHYVGRPSPLGNPFVLKHEGERERVIGQYRDWLKTRLEARDQAIRTALNDLYRELVTRGELELTCWCAPRRCHAEVIAEFLAEAAARRGLRVEISRG
jgi:hypothetical protein